MALDKIFHNRKNIEAVNGLNKLLVNKTIYVSLVMLEDPLK